MSWPAKDTELAKLGKAILKEVKGVVTGAEVVFGELTLTATHVVFQGSAGKDVVVPLLDITEVKDQPIRRRHLYGHDSQLIIRTEYGQAGFLTDDPAGWADAISEQLRAAREP